MIIFEIIQNLPPGSFDRDGPGKKNFTTTTTIDIILRRFFYFFKCILNFVFRSIQFFHFTIHCPEVSFWRSHFLSFSKLKADMSLLVSEFLFESLLVSSLKIIASSLEANIVSSLSIIASSLKQILFLL